MRRVLLCDGLNLLSVATASVTRPVVASRPRTAKLDRMQDEYLQVMACARANSAAAEHSRFLRRAVWIP
jgi:hypothetical protein